VESSRTGKRHPSCRSAVHSENRGGCPRSPQGHQCTQFALAPFKKCACIQNLRRKIGPCSVAHDDIKSRVHVKQTSRAGQHPGFAALKTL
jgi:hypothetical protein